MSRSRRDRRQGDLWHPRHSRPRSSRLAWAKDLKVPATFAPAAATTPGRTQQPRKASGSSCERIGCQTASSNPSSISSIIAASPGTRSLTNLGKSCPRSPQLGSRSLSLRIAIFLVGALARRRISAPGVKLSGPWRGVDTQAASPDSSLTALPLTLTVLGEGPVGLWAPNFPRGQLRMVVMIATEPQREVLVRNQTGQTVVTTCTPARGGVG
jgi:hypothetical protein